MSSFNDPANISFLVGLWDFEDGSKLKDTGTADGQEQDGVLFGDATISGGQLKLNDDDGDRFEVDGYDDVFEGLTEGTIRVRFNQEVHNGGSPDTLVSRGEYNTKDSDGLFDLRVTDEGEVEAFHLMADGTEVKLTTDKDTFKEGDDVEVWYSWDETTGATLTVVNHSSGEVFTEADNTTGLTMDVGDDDDESFTFGAREKEDGGPFDKEFTGTMDYVAIYNKEIDPELPEPPTDYEPTTTSDLLTLWEFEEDGETTVDDLAPKGGLEDGEVKDDAEQKDGFLQLDGYKDHMVAQPDPDWQLDEGRVELVFNQDAGQSGNGALLSRDSANLDDGGHLTIWANDDGSVLVRHQTDSDSKYYGTPAGFFDKGDDVRVTYAWDSDGVNGFLKVENLTDGTVYEEAIDEALTIDNGSTSEPFVVGASSIYSDDNDANHLVDYFDGKISYVAIYDKAAAQGDFVVEGDNDDNLIDINYTGDPEGDMIDANDNQVPNNDDVVDARGGDDVVLAGDGDDLVYAGSGNDSVEGDVGNDTIFGDSGGSEATTVRESFEWDLAGVAAGETINSFSQDTGNVTVDFFLWPSNAGAATFADNDQQVAGIDSGSETIDDNSSFESLMQNSGDQSTFALTFSEDVTNVSFRINDIDGDGVVRVFGSLDGVPVEVELTAGVNLTLLDNDGILNPETAASNGGYEPDDSPNYSILVEIPGPLDSIMIEHIQDGDNDTGVNFTDVYFDAIVGDDGEPGDDTLLGDEGEDLIFGEGGDDSIDGGIGNDTIYGDNPPEGTVVGPNLIVNGSFEDTTGATTTGYGFEANSGIPGWTEDSGEPFDIHNDGRGGVNPTDGNNWLDLDQSPGNVRVGQDVAGVVDGETYRLTFDAGDSNAEPQSGSGENLVNVYWGGELVGTIDPNAGTMDTYTFDLVGGAGNGNNRLEFEGTGDEDNIGASIDSVRLEQIAGVPDEDSGSDTITDLDGDNVVISGPIGSPDQDFPGDAYPVADADPNDDRDSVTTGGGNDSIVTGDDDDTISAGGGADTIDAGFDDDEIDAGGGADFVEGGEGNDTIQGGDGDDTIFGNEETPNIYDEDDDTDPVPGNDRDSIDAGEGNDSVEGGDDDDTIKGGIGNDTLDGGLDDDSIEGGSGEDRLIGGDGDDTLRGNDDDDRLFGGDGDDSLSGGSGNDRVFGNEGEDTLVGGSGDDIMDGGLDNDTITGGSGSDEIRDTDGDNVINAGITGLPDRGVPFVPGDDDADSVPPGDPNDDRDLVVTGDGNDTITTGDDQDTIVAGDGENVIDAGFDDDRVTSGTGDDSITLGEGSDTVFSGGGNDTIFGGLGTTTIVPDGANLIDDNNVPSRDDPILDNGDDYIDAGAGNDSVLGEDDNDTILGGSGQDTLDGGIDDDSIDGGIGDDSIIGGQGADTLKGGFGDDTFDVGIFDDPLFSDNDLYEEGIGDSIVGGEDADDGDIDVLDLSDAGPLRIFKEDSIDPGGESGESGRVVFYEDAAKTIVKGELVFKEIEDVIPCFTPGTLIATPKGEVPVESLKAGDVVVTRDNGLQEIRWVGSRTMEAEELETADMLRPILIKAGALGHGLPERDMVVSPQHRVLMTGELPQLYFEDSEVLVAAKHLVNGDTIVQLGAEEDVTYIHFMFDRHEVVLSDGAWTESFQPGDQSLGSMGDAQRAEIFAIFPELATVEGLGDYTAARRALKAHEAKLLQL